MRVVLPAAMVCGALAFAQAPTQDRNFRFAYTESPQQMQEVSTVIHHIADVDTSVDETQKTMNAVGTADQMGIAAWLFNEFDRPGNQEPHPVDGAVREQHMPGAGTENVVRIFYLPYAESIRQFQEVVTAVRSAVSIRRMFTYNAPRAVVTRATADQTAAAAWLFDQLGTVPAQNAPRAEYRMPGPGDDVIRVLYLPNAKTPQDFQEIAAVIRSISDMRQLFTYLAPKAIVARGTSDQAALSSWLANELDASPSHTAASVEYRMPGGPENMVRVFYLPKTATVPDFQRKVQAVRMQTGARYAFTYNGPRAVALRGTVTQIEQATALLSGPNQ